MNPTQTATTGPVKIPANHAVTKRLGRGRVKDAEGRTAAGGRRIVLTGQLRHGEIRVHRGGIAQLSAMFSREYLADLRRAHAEGGFPTVDDPARTA